ncbi:MAG: glycosyltransferase family 2 protein [Chitinophagaceae bacterium]|nr:MAG: glycosyltransferase family 2 protein [Chitinophagaceae bacterium]
MNHQPLVSVLMTCYNREEFISEAIESVLATTYPNIELLVVDDSSSDQSVQIAERFAQADHRVRFFINEKNMGDYPNRNKAASLARGKYIVFTDSDDWMFADALEQWVDWMEKEGAEFGIFKHGISEKPMFLPSSKTIRMHFFSQPVLMNGPTATITVKAYFEKVGGFPEKFGPANDMYYNLKAASQTTTLFFPFPLNGYRIHGGQERNNRHSYLYNNYLYLQHALKELNLDLTAAEIKYLSSKNKRRFVTNSLSFLRTVDDRTSLIKALRITKFSMVDLLKALYIKSL